MILRLDRESHTPIYLQIAQQIEALISEGTMKVGDRLPPSRALAARLGVHRTTASHAYAELEDHGVIQAHVGRGTFVAALPSTARKLSSTPHDPPPFSPLFWNSVLIDEVKKERLRSLLHDRPSEEFISFAYALPSPELLPVDDVKHCVDRVLRQEGRTLLQMGETLGYVPLREYLIGRLSAAGIQIKAEEILITNGCQQSLDLIRRALVAPGDTVLVENPTYPGALTVFDAQDVRCLGIPLGEKGLDLAALEDVLSRHSAKLLYVTPNFQNPTGSTLDLAARRQLLALAVKYRLPIVEDDIYGELRYDGSSLPSLKALDEKGVVIYLSSFSKVGFAGMRVGWIAASSLVIDRLSLFKQSSDIHTNVLAQATLCELSRQGMLDRFLKRARRLYAERRDRMLAAMQKYFPSGAMWSHPEGGMSIWVRLPLSLDATHILSRAVQEGVVFSPGVNFYLGTPRMNTLRLTFSTMEAARIDEGIKRLGSLLKKQLSRAKAQEARYEAVARTALV